MNTLFHDLRYGLRMLAKNPGFAGIAVITLALGIGANVAVFSLVDELWMRPRPVPHPERVVRIFTSNPTSEGAVVEGYSSYPDYRDIAQQAKSFSGVAALEIRGGLLDTGTESKAGHGRCRIRKFLRRAAAYAGAGRTFTASEANSPGTLVVMLSYPFWRQQFNGDPTLPGRTILLDGKHMLVDGILPQGFRGTEPAELPDV